MDIQYEGIIMKLRPYQEEAVNSIISSYNSGIKRQLIVLPTGSGKTILIAAVLRLFENKKVLIVSHRSEILNQTLKTMELYLDARVSVYYSRIKDLSGEIVIGTIQSCHRERSLSSIQDKNFDLLIIDEAHHSCAKTYKKLIRAISPSLLLGFTATPSLANGNTLGEIYQKITYSKQVKELIDAGFLSDVYGRKIRIEFNLKSVRSKRGDFVNSSLSAAINRPSVNNVIVEKYKEHVKKGKAIAFCVNISHAINLSKAFNAGGINSSFIYGTMKDVEKRKHIDALRSGGINVLTSVGVLTEGFDMPEIDTIVMTRPTKSKSLYIQMVGRGLRKAMNKNKCFVLDFVDVNHNLLQAISLDIVIPHAKIDTDIINGDCSEIPKIKKDIEASILSILDEELNLLNIELVNKKPIALPESQKNEKSVRASNSFLAMLKRGEIGGRAPFGYKNIGIKGRPKDVIVDKKQAEIIKFAFDEYSSTECSFRELSLIVKKKFGIDKSKSSWANIISNYFYVGIIKNKVFGNFTHRYKRIISAETFALAKQKRSRAGSGKSARFIKHDHTYRGVITCYRCGCTLSGDIKKKKYTYYSCTMFKGKHPKISLTNNKIESFFKKLFSNIIIDDSNISLASNFLKKRYPQFRKKTDEEFNLMIYKARNYSPEFYASLSGSNKRMLLRILFKKIQEKDGEILVEVNEPFDKIITV